MLSLLLLVYSHPHCHLAWLWLLFDWLFPLFLCKTSSTLVDFLPRIGISGSRARCPVFHLVCQLWAAHHLALCLLACRRARTSACVRVYVLQLPRPIARCCRAALLLSAGFANFPACVLLARFYHCTPDSLCLVSPGWVAHDYFSLGSWVPSLPSLGSWVL